ncbi:MAG: protein translocase subunit SecF [Candidatus Electryonea clarkiae]|nr:protein translocase subunit SecF [Candidatus Electryonea clarkiae]MDP8287662.1 protein translocase subunit SecF [Candidatus Electryonea clarkiae]
MFQIIKNPNFDFQSKRRIAFMISAAIILIGLIATVIRGGPNYSIDFVGGIQVILRFENSVDEATMRSTLSELGYPDAEVKMVVGGGRRDLMIRLIQSSEGTDQVAEVENQLTEHFKDNPYEVLSVDQVGPKIGRELRKAALMAIVASLFFIVIYISWRFQYRFAIAAIIALIHDVLIVFGLFSILNLQMSLAIIAAFLTIVGYSLNDTIVVFDRIRENVKRMRFKSLVEQINTSINDTLSRTILTSSTTLIVVIILFIFGGSVIHDFALALLAGVLVGTYSSIFVASPILVEWNLWHPDKRSKK